MRPRLALGAAAAAASVAAAAAVRLREPARRDRLERTLRVWRLTVRRGVHYGVTKVRGAAADEQRRRELDERFAIRSAEDVTRELGNMKGVVMKAGQMLSFILDGLPEAAQASLASLQSDVPAMAPGLAAGVVERELGAPPHDLFLDWSEQPVAAASIGQVHRAVLRDGREVAVKVQYPGVDTAIASDLANAGVLYSLFSQVTLKSLDVEGLVAELRNRMTDELDYRLEASCQAEFAARYADHPFIHVPAVVPELSTGRVLTSEWVDGMRFAEFLEQADEPARQHAAEVLFRFVQGAIYRARVFNGDPHPGNYLFHRDGTVTFIDFGLVKRWDAGELEALLPLIDPLLDHDAAAVVTLMERTGFLHPGHGLDPEHVWEYVSRPYVPYLEPEFTFTSGFTADALGTLLDLNGPYKDVMQRLDMPSSFVILDRVVWGMSALLGRLGARNRWREILAEYRFDAPPVTPLGRREQEWRAQRSAGRG